MTALSRLIAVGFLASLAGGGLAATSEDPLFAEDSVVSITLSGPLRAMSRDRADDPEYRPGTLSLAGANALDSGDEEKFEIRIRPRGKSRRDRSVCRFPPLRVNFKKGQVKNTLFAGQNALKLVTHCQTSESFQRYVLKEYLVYRIFNLLTDVSFRVRLLKVTYVDSETNAKPYERFGFFMEHKNRLAIRMGTTVAEPVRIQSAELDPVQASIGELFQYLVSNTDFSFLAAPPGETCCHNAILLHAEDGKYLPVPYDFDRTGLVDPPSALPDENLGQRTVRDRLFRGFCRPEPYLSDGLAKVQSQRSAIHSLIRGQTDLSSSDQNRMLKFVDDFYRIIDDERDRERKLKCRRPL